MNVSDPLETERPLREVLEDVELPLKNVEYTIEQYLLVHGSRLDIETRYLLAGVRDCVGRIAGATRLISGRPGAEEAGADLPLFADLARGG